MALQNPLENYNRHNPYVMQAKRQYQILMDENEELSKEFLIVSIIAGFDAIVCLIVGIIGCLFSGAASLIPMIGSFLFIALFEHSAYKILKERIQDEKNKEMDRMASLEMSEVQEINVEFVYNLINLIHSLQGKAIQARKSLRSMSILLLGGTLGYLMCIFTLVIIK